MDADSHNPNFIPQVETAELMLSACELAGLVAEVLDKGAPVRFVARGTSMSPVIRDGDTITLLAAAGERVRRGEVVAFKQPDTDRIIVHRILGRSGRSVLLRGDNTSRSDGPIPCDRILGRVLRVERRGRTVIFGGGAERWLFWLFFRSTWPRRAARRLLRLVPRRRQSRATG